MEPQGRVRSEGWDSTLRRALGRLRAFARRRPEPLPAPPQPRLGLALGGGFARGLAHIGVLKVLEEKRVRVHCLAGTSVGSLIAGAYASGVSLEEIEAVARRVRWKDFAQWTVSRLGLASNQRLETMVRRLFRAVRFEDLRMPLAVVATDLTRGQPVVFTAGELAPAIRASCAYPGLFLPVAQNGSWLADGGLVALVPTEAARALGADVVLAVAPHNLELGLEPKNVADVLARAFSIAQRAAEPVWREHADLVLEPPVSAFHWDDFERAEELIAAGEEAMRAAWPELRRLLEAGVAKSSTAR